MRAKTKEVINRIKCSTKLISKKLWIKRSKKFKLQSAYHFTFWQTKYFETAWYSFINWKVKSLCKKLQWTASSIYLSTYLYIYISIYLSIYLYIYRSIWWFALVTKLFNCLFSSTMSRLHAIFLAAFLLLDIYVQ